MLAEDRDGIATDTDGSFAYFYALQCWHTSAVLPMVTKCSLE